MVGTLVNTGAVIAGSCIGLLLKKGIPDKIHLPVTKMLGVSTAIIGLNGIITSMITTDVSGKLQSNGSLLLFISLVIGVIAGELIGIDDKLNGVGAIVEKKFKLDGVSKGFIDASIIFCVGAMAIIGSLNDGLKGDPSVLFIKSALDFTTCIILSSSLGIGVMFSAVTILLYQGAITLLAGIISPFISPQMLVDVCMVGYVIVMCIGMNFMEMVKIKTANLLPAMLVPIVYNLLIMFNIL